MHQELAGAMTHHSGNHTGKTSGMRELRHDNRDTCALSAHTEDNIVGTHGARDPRAMSVVRTGDNILGTHDARAMSVPRTGDNILGTHGVPAMPLTHLQDSMQGIHDFRAPVQYGASDSDEDDFAGDETIIASKGKGREMDSDTGLATQTILSEIDQLPPHPRVSTYDPNWDYQHNHSSADTQSQSVPPDPNSFMAYYNSSGSFKRDRDYDAESAESRQSKVYRRSTSHSAAPSAGPSVPGTKAPTRSASRVSVDDGNVSPVDDSDRHGASRTTGGTFRGRAIGSALNWADIGMYYFILEFFQVFRFFLLSSDAMNVDNEEHQTPDGKVLLYSSRDDNVPVMSIKHKTTNKLPTILNEIAQRYSPIRSKYIIFYWCHNS